MCILPNATPVVPSQTAAIPVVPAQTTTPAARSLPPTARRQLALEALAGQSISELAAQEKVSRKFVYQQLQHAHNALDQAFQPPDPDPDGLLFWLPITKPWLQQLVLGLVLICHSPLRGVTELLDDLFDCDLSLGTVHNILHQAVPKAHQVNQRQDLSGIRVGAHDEIFQAGRPVLVGADVASTSCYLLSREEHRDADTWGVRLLELQDRGFQPDATIADFAGGLRAAQAEVLPGVPCRGDVFHVLHVAVPLVTYLENRAYEAMTACDKLQRQQAQHERRHGRKAADVAGKLRAARPVEARAVALAEEVAVLVQWLREDLLAVAGPDHATRCALYDWIVAELRTREEQCPHRIRPVRTLLENQRDALLAFAAVLDQELATLAEEYAVPVATVRSLLQLQALPHGSATRGQQQAVLEQPLGERSGPLQDAVRTIASGVVRASSVIENLNSRLRNYFFLRRQLGPDYLALLQFFLNHRCFQRSRRAERMGKSPAELLTGQAQPHWLELLGYTPFSRN
jgi:hypothetical protein